MHLNIKGSYVHPLVTISMGRSPEINYFFDVVMYYKNAKSPIAVGVGNTCYFHYVHSFIMA